MVSARLRLPAAGRVNFVAHHPVVVAANLRTTALLQTTELLKYGSQRLQLEPSWRFQPLADEATSADERADECKER